MADNGWCVHERGCGDPATPQRGTGPARTIQTGIGKVEVQRTKVRDRAEVADEAKIRFTSSILPRWARRSRSLEALLPIL